MSAEGAVAMLVSPSLFSEPLKEPNASTQSVQLLRRDMPMSAQCQHVRLIFFFIPEGGSPGLHRGYWLKPRKVCF